MLIKHQYILFVSKFYYRCVIRNLQSAKILVWYTETKLYIIMEKRSPPSVMCERVLVDDDLVSKVCRYKNVFYRAIEKKTGYMIY